MHAQKGQTSLRSIEGRKVSVALRNGTRLVDCDLVSSGRNRLDNLWLFVNGEDVFVAAQRCHRCVYVRRRPAVGGLTDTPAGVATVGPAPDEIAASRARARRLAQLARPVLERLGDDLSDAPISVVLADRDGWIIDRRGEAGALHSTLDRAGFMTGRQWDEIHTGTNAVGTALASSAPVIVRGPEHVADSLARVTSAASPIVDPRTGQLLGVLALVCAIEDSNVLMLPYACRASREIASQLVDEVSLAERALKEHFVRTAPAARCAMVSVSARSMLTNAAAAHFVDESDHARLWQWAVRMFDTRPSRSGELEVSGGRCVMAECEPVLCGSETVGALIRIAAPAAATAPPREGRRVADPWDG